MSDGRGRDRLYWREDREGWYMDLRDLGHGQKACVPEDERTATEDRDEAVGILSDRLDEIEAEEKDRQDPRLEKYAQRHLRRKSRSSKASTVERDDTALRNVLAYFGRDVRLSEIDVAGLSDYWDHRSEQPGNRQGTTVSPQTILHELHALSSLYSRAVAEEVAEVNPVSRMSQKPSVGRREQTWLEPGEAARLLGAAFENDPDPHPRALPYFGVVLSAFLHTGGRKSEVLGLLRRDVDLVSGTVHFRANEYRTLKRRRHDRRVPLWPDFNEALRDYLNEHDRAEDALLFPARSGGMISDVRGVLSTAVDDAEIEKHVTAHVLRHTYAAQRLQTTDRGAPVSPYTVMRELGHSSLRLIEKTYGHLMDRRDRSPVVQYREAEVVELEEERAG